MLLRWKVSTLLVWTWLAAVPCMAANIMFTDCLSAPPPNGIPYFKPTGATAVFQNEQGSSNNTMAVTVYGEAVNGQLIDLNTSTNKYTTLKVNVDMLQYSEVDRYERFCQFVNNGTCPFVNGSFTVTYGLTDSFQGVSVDNEFTIIDTSTPGIIIGCVAIEVTPILATYVWYILVFGVLGVFLAFCAIYVISSFWNPWTGTKDVFLSTSIYRQDVNSIRLITPGTFDFVKYLQHAVLVTGGLNLAYPGFLPPIVSSAAWSCLLFAVNFATKRTSQLQDNIYAIFGRFGLSRLARVIKLDADSDIWPSFIVWLVIVVSAIVVLSLVVVAVSWTITNNKTSTLRESIRNHGLYFVGGNIIRLVYNLFAVPFVAFCFFQLLIIKRKHSSIAADFFAGLLLLLWLLGAIFLGYKVWNMPQDTRYNDLKLKLLYGPLYNTYSENRSAFCLIDLAIAFFKGLTIGAIQDSGLAQITILATIEVCYLFALWTLRPYASKTNMNVTQSLLTCVRLITTFLLMAFVASMNTNAAVKGWIGYAILLIHALIILIAAIHCVQVLIEVIARINGAGANTRPELTIDTSYQVKHSLPPNRDSTMYGDGTKTPDGLLSNQSAIGHAKGMKAVKRGSFPNYHQRSDSFIRKSSFGDGRRRESVFDDVFVSSPTSEISPVSANPAKLGYYRAPRHRRQSSHDWAYGVPGKEKVPQDVSGKGSVAASVYEGDDDFTFVKKAQTDMSAVDYAVRESDLYYTQRHHRSASVASDQDYISDYEEYDEFKKRNSGNALLEEIAASSSSPYNYANKEQPSAVHTTSAAPTSQSSKWDFIHKFKDSIGKRRKSVTPMDNIEPTGSGFQVMRRAPIKAYKALPRGPEGRPSSDMELNTFKGRASQGDDAMSLVDDDDHNEGVAVMERADQLDSDSSSDNFLECMPPSNFTNPSINKKDTPVMTPDGTYSEGIAHATTRKQSEPSTQPFDFESRENTM